MVSNGLVKPGLDHPPPWVGEGDRDNDMLGWSPCRGLPGREGNGAANLRAVSPDVAPRVLRAAGFGGTVEDFTLDERRRRCVSG